MLLSRRTFARNSLLLLAGARLAHARNTKPTRVLIVDGMNNHDWRSATAAIQEILTRTGRFSVGVSTTPPADARQAEWDAWNPSFSSFSVVINNFNSGDDANAILWPERVRQSLESYVKAGGGLVSYHAANNAFLLWPAYNEMIGMGWRPPSYGPQRSHRRS